LRGAQFLTASASAEGDLFEILRCCGFTPYDWQTFWKLSQPKSEVGKKFWNRSADADAPTVLGLQKHLMTPALQAVYQPGLQNLPNYILRVDGELLGYASLLAGRKALVITPILSPSAENPFDLIASLSARFLNGEKPVYIRQTSSMSWLTSHLDIGATLILKRQELLIKHFTVRNPINVSEMKTVANPQHANPAVPFAQSTDSQNHL